MQTILAFSDSHHAPLPQKLLDVAAEADHIFFLGDGSMSLNDLLFHKNLHIVDGNCDPPCFGNEKVIDIEGVRILLTHGHIYSVKRDLLPLAMRAQELNCQAVFYGHTHLARIDEYPITFNKTDNLNESNARKSSLTNFNNDVDANRITLICSGSPCYPAGACASYAYAVVHNGKITAKIVDLI